MEPEFAWQENLQTLAYEIILIDSEHQLQQQIPLFLKSCLASTDLTLEIRQFEYVHSFCSTVSTSPGPLFLVSSWSPAPAPECFRQKYNLGMHFNSLLISSPSGSCLSSWKLQVLWREKIDDLGMYCNSTWLLLRSSPGSCSAPGRFWYSGEKKETIQKCTVIVPDVSGEIYEKKYVLGMYDVSSVEQLCL